MKNFALTSDPMTRAYVRGRGLITFGLYSGSVCIDCIKSMDACEFVPVSRMITYTRCAIARYEQDQAEGRLSVNGTPADLFLVVVGGYDGFEYDSCKQAIEFAYVDTEGAVMYQSILNELRLFLRWLLECQELEANYAQNVLKKSL